MSFDSSRILAGISSLSVLAFTALAISACPGSLENKAQFLDGGTDNCGDVPATIIGPRCATANCHDSDMPLNNLDLTPDEGLADRLIGVAGDMCPGDLVDAANPEASLMYTKVLVTTSCGIQMPQTGEKLTAEEEQCMLEWIQEITGNSGTGGAPPSGGAPPGGGAPAGGAPAGGAGGTPAGGAGGA